MFESPTVIVPANRRVVYTRFAADFARTWRGIDLTTFGTVDTLTNAPFFGTRCENGGRARP